MANAGWSLHSRSSDHLSMLFTTDVTVSPVLSCRVMKQQDGDGWEALLSYMPPNELMFHLVNTGAFAFPHSNWDHFVRKITMYATLLEARL